ncbi:MAG: hypothetical protein ABIY52_08925, partial [Gemmatimonadaceae bacterium]
MKHIGRRDFLLSAALLGVAAPLLSRLRAVEGAERTVDPRWLAMPEARTTPAPMAGEILPLTSTSEVFVPPKGRTFMKFSFDFPEPAVVIGDYRFGFNVFTDENAYSLDGAHMKAETKGDVTTLTCDRFTWAGGQETAPGSLVATFRHVDGALEWSAVAHMQRPIKTITTVIRGVPRGQLSFGNGGFFDPRDNEILAGYPFG